MMVNVTILLFYRTRGHNGIRFCAFIAVHVIAINHSVMYHCQLQGLNLLMLYVSNLLNSKKHDL